MLTSSLDLPTSDLQRSAIQHTATQFLGAFRLGGVTGTSVFSHLRKLSFTDSDQTAGSNRKCPTEGLQGAWPRHRKVDAIVSEPLMPLLGLAASFP